MNNNKAFPVYSGFLAYFPDAIKAVAGCSQVCNDQHNPGEPLHWAREKGGSDIDALSRHLLKVGSIDDDGVRHSAKVAWRALANLQREIETDEPESLTGKVMRERMERIKNEEAFCGHPGHGLFKESEGCQKCTTENDNQQINDK